MIAVVKIGTSSITDDHGAIDDAAVTRLCDQVAAGLHRRDIEGLAFLNAVVDREPAGDEDLALIAAEAVLAAGRLVLRVIEGDDKARAHGTADGCRCFHLEAMVFREIIQFQGEFAPVQLQDLELRVLGVLGHDQAGAGQQAEGVAA